jgi:hypothetical protein
LRADALLLAAVVCSAASAAAEDSVPETRVEQWTRLRREKAARPAPASPGFLERTLLALEKAEGPSLLDFNVRGVYPRVQNIASGSETAFGVRVWRPDLGSSRLDLHASAFHSIRGYEYYDLQVGRLPHRGTRFPARSTRGDDVYELGDLARLDAGHLSLYGSMRYRHYPQLGFYGLGAEARREDRTSFLHQDALYEVVAGYQGRRRGLSAMLRAGFLQAFAGPGTSDEAPTIRPLFDDASAPGLDRQPDFLHLAASVLLDGRDRPFNPHRGGMIAVAASRFDERAGDAFTFHRIAGDARGYASLGSPQRVLAVRALASADRPASGARVPFYLQEQLGGGRTLRGFHSFRFRGEKLLLLQAEYRWEAWPALEFALFADAGRAYGRGEELALRGLETDYGIGLRLKTHDAVLARFDVARSREDTRFLLRLGPSF